jgi:hypothetical protein
MFLREIKDNKIDIGGVNIGQMLILFKYCNKFTIIIGIFPGYFIYGRN